MGLEVGNGAQQPPTPTPIPTEEDIDALLEAARYDDIDDIKSLASAGVSLNSKDSQGRTALHMAAANGHLDIVDYLIGNGVINQLVSEQERVLAMGRFNKYIVPRMDKTKKGKNIEDEVSRIRTSRTREESNGG